MHGLAGEIVDAVPIARDFGPGQDDLRHRLRSVGRDEVDDLLALVGDGEVAGGDVAQALGDVLQQLVARRRDR